MGSRHYADICMAQLGATHPAVSATLQQTQQFDLHGERNVTDLVQKQRAATGCFNQSSLARYCTGERSALMAKQFGLKQVLRQTGAIDRYQGAVCTRAGLMHCVCHQFLAGSRFTLQQHSGLRGRHACHQFQHAQKGTSASGQALRFGLPLRDSQGLHAFDKKRLFTSGVTQGRKFNLDVFIALGRVVQVQDPLALT